MPATHWLPYLQKYEKCWLLCDGNNTICGVVTLPGIHDTHVSLKIHVNCVFVLKSHKGIEEILRIHY